RLLVGVREDDARTDSGSSSVLLSPWRAVGARSTTGERSAARVLAARRCTGGAPPSPDASGTANRRGERRERPERGHAAAQPPWGWTVNKIPSTPWVHRIRQIEYLRPGLAPAFLSLCSARVLGCRFPLDDALSSPAGGRRRTHGAGRLLVLGAGHTHQPAAGQGSRPFRRELPRQQRGADELLKVWRPWRPTAARRRRPMHPLGLCWQQRHDRRITGFTVICCSPAWRAGRAAGDEVLVDFRGRLLELLPGKEKAFLREMEAHLSSPPSPLP
ncbi:hypothetical protein PVAP13_3KG120427, partial [Panicum virgatum]